MNMLKKFAAVAMIGALQLGTAYADEASALKAYMDKQAVANEIMGKMNQASTSKERNSYSAAYKKALEELATAQIEYNQEMMKARGR